jgi:hypothetical protein
MLLCNLKIKPVKTQLWSIGLLAILLGSLIGCKPSLISIDDVFKKKAGKTVYLTGKVTHLAPFVDLSAYQIEDQTGNVWVVTPETPPQVGKMVTIKGKIEYQSLPFDQQELGGFYLVELQQLETPISSHEKSVISQ